VWGVKRSGDSQAAGAPKQLKSKKVKGKIEKRRASLSSSILPFTFLLFN
jgi:hypothetical protein